MDNRIAYLLERYLDKRLTASEESEFFEYVENPETADIIKQAIDNDLSREDREPILGKNDLYLRILQRNAISPVRKNRFGSLFAAATAASAAMIVLLLWWSPVRNPIDRLMTSYGGQDSTVMYHNKQQIELPDGSVIFLREKSRLISYYRNGEFSREVALDGEAYFDIQQNAGSRFIVRSGDITTTVLGTAFNIRSRGKDTEVVVTRGLVEVSGNNKIYGRLSAHEQLRITDEKANLQVLPPEDAAAYTMDVLPLIFEESTLAHVLARVSDRFDATIVLENQSLANCRISARFMHGEDLEDILEIICLMRHASFSAEGKEITIRGGKPCN
jgi:transmembrane sensor